MVLIIILLPLFVKKATILEENVRLTKELAKFTTSKNKMSLDDLCPSKGQTRISMDLDMICVLK